MLQSEIKVAYAECEDQQTTVRARDDSLDINDFYPIQCRPHPVPQILTEVKMMPVCENVTKQHCDTKWALNAAGEKVWAGNENCKEVTWEDCSLQPRNVTTEVETYDCAEDDTAILYQTVSHNKVFLCFEIFLYQKIFLFLKIFSFIEIFLCFEIFPRLMCRCSPGPAVPWLPPCAQ